MGSFRTKASKEEYKRAIHNGHLDGDCNLCAEEKSPTIKRFHHWRIIANKFPYDAVSTTHDMILPIRHVREDGLTQDEWEEYMKLKETHISENYDFLFEPTSKTKSIPGHFHIHLLIAKDFSET